MRTSWYRTGRGSAHMECEACLHHYVLDVEIQDDGEVMPIYPKHCPECGANYDLDLVGVIRFR